jgi:hypothetical protein
MHPQLNALIHEFNTASERLQQLVEAVSAELWPHRPRADRWSVGECVAHLNLTGAAYILVLRQALAEHHDQKGSAPARYRRDPIGWLLWRTMGPPVRMGMKTTAPFIPQAVMPAIELAGEFERLQREQIACVEQADGLPLQKIRIRSPFNERVRYNLYSALSILPRHQHRHLWQAEETGKLLPRG